MATGVSVVIQATDRASGTIEAINRRLRGIAAPGERFVRAVGRLSDTSGLTAASRGVAALTRNVAAGAASLGRFTPALGALTGAASIAGIAQLTERWTGFGVRLGLDAQRIGVTADRLHGLQGAARLAGASAEDLTGGLRTLGDNLFDAVGGRSPETVVLLSQLGIAFRDSATGGARLADAVLPEVADKIASLRSPALQARVATQLFGAAGEALLPFLRRGAAGIAEYRREAERYGVTNQRGVDAANDLRIAQSKLGLAVEGVAYTVAERLAPVLVPMLGRLSDWVSAHRDDVGAFFTRVATGIGSWVEGGGIERTITSLREFGTQVDGVVQVFGGWTRAAEILGVALALKVVGPMAMIAAKLAFFSGWAAPRWLLGLLGLGGAATGAVTAAAVAGLASGATAGKMNMPLLDDYGRPLGNWGGAEGERNNAASAGLGSTPQSFMDTMRRMLGLSGGGMNTGSGPQGMTPSEAIARGRGTPQSSPATQITPASTALPAGGGRAAFVANYGAAAQIMAQQTGTSASFWLGQWGLETGWGRAAAGNNLGNIKAGGSWTGATVRQADGLQYRAYGTPEEFARDQAALIRRRYPGVLNRGDDAAGAAAALKAGGYAEDPNYVGKVTAAVRALGPALPPNGVPPVGPTFGPPVQAPPAPLPPQPLGAAAGVNGAITVTTDHRNAPPGVTQTVTAAGDVQMGGMRISRPMIGLIGP